MYLTGIKNKMRRTNISKTFENFNNLKHETRSA